MNPKGGFPGDLPDEARVPWIDPISKNPVQHEILSVDRDGRGTIIQHRPV